MKALIQSYRLWAVGMAIILFALPFFWFKPGVMDIGGDGGRLYFYDPINQIRHIALYYVSPFGTGGVDASFFYLPFFSLIAGIKYITGSSFVVIWFNNAVKLSVGFLSMYGIIKELTGKRINKFFVEGAAILSGLFYLSTPAMTENYIKALPSHNQVFLNPLMFYLMLRFFITAKNTYLWWMLFVSVIFSINFSYTAAPAIFAFYPFALLFICFYSMGIRHIRPPTKKILIGLLLFLGLHAFHLLPEISDLVTSGSNTNIRVFSIRSIQEQIDYFYGVLHIPKISFHLLSLSAANTLPWASVVIPFTVLLGLILNKKRESAIVLATAFFLMTFFLVTGKVTMSGIKLYEWFFYLPGFTMFRNFYGQWQFAFYFFYALLFGLTTASIIKKISSGILVGAFFIGFVGYFVMSSWSFISGSLVNLPREETKGIKGAIVMDPDYEATLTFIRTLPVDGKILDLPFTDSYIQVIHGTNVQAAYVGRSTIGQLTGKNDFAGYQDIMPFSDTFWQLAKAKDYHNIKKIFAILNIRYIFHNADPRIYDETFPFRPYSPNYVRKYMPANQAEYGEFIKNLSGGKIFERSFYKIYSIGGHSYIPHVYAADEIILYQNDPKVALTGQVPAFFMKEETRLPLYVEREVCDRRFYPVDCRQGRIIMQDSPKIEYRKISPTRYKVTATNVIKPFVLGFLEAYHKDWRVLIGDRFLSDQRHLFANGYANAWLIKPEDIQGREESEIIIEMTGQRFFYAGLAVSLSVVMGLGMWKLRQLFFSRQT